MTAKKRQARLTNDPMAIRANCNTVRGRRLRDLFAAFAVKLDPKDVIGHAAALRAAELTTLAEDIRESICAADLKSLNPDLLKQLGLIENLVDRAERRLGLLAANGPKAPTLSDWLVEEDGADVKA
jgi:hypothetical protein